MPHISHPINAHSHVKTPAARELMEQLAQQQAIHIDILSSWLNSQPGLSSNDHYRLLHLCEHYHLNPLLGEVGSTVHANGQTQLFITIDGYTKLMNQHPAYAGLTLREGIDGAGELAWMECSIYRHDRVLPITIKEYLNEVRINQTPWEHMPKRMLRHRAVQQCARLAFGFSVPEFALTTTSTSSTFTTTDQVLHSSQSSITTPNLSNNANKTARKDLLKRTLQNTSLEKSSKNRLNKPAPIEKETP